MTCAPEMAPGVVLSPTIKAILEVSMTYFSGFWWQNSSPELYEGVESALRMYLTREIPYEVANHRISMLVGPSHPLERVRQIVELNSDPIPDPYAFSQKRNHQRKKTRAWSAYEDQRLLSGIYHHGIENWTAISKFVGNGRNRSQCSQRWYRGLDPTISKDKWSKEEESRLCTLIDTYGDKSWTHIATMMGNRTDVQCRYKYKQILKEKAGDGHQKKRRKAKTKDKVDKTEAKPLQLLPPIGDLINQCSALSAIQAPLFLRK